MAAIKQRDLNLMDRESLDDFEITGRNTDTDAPSRMYAGEFLATLTERVEVLEESGGGSFPLSDVHVGDNIRGMKIIFGGQDKIVYDDNISLVRWTTRAGAEYEINYRGTGITYEEPGLVQAIYDEGEGWLMNEIEIPDDQDYCVIGVEISSSTPVGNWSFADAVLQSAVSIPVRVSKLETRYSALENSIDTINYRLSALEQANYRRYGDLSSAAGSGISFTLQDVNIIVRRIDTTTLEIRATAHADMVIPITHSYRGNNTLETIRETFTVTQAGVVIGTINVGSYVLAEFWTQIGGYGFDIVAGSDDNALTQAWVEVKRHVVLSDDVLMSSKGINTYANTGKLCELSQEQNNVVKSSAAKKSPKSKKK